MSHLDQTNIKNALVELLKVCPPGQAGGFVIFGGKTDLDYVQFSLEPTGLLLNWPTAQPGGTERLPQFVTILQQLGFAPSVSDQSVDAREEIQRLTPNAYLVADDGLYAQCGRDLNTVADLSALLLTEVFEVSDLPENRITLELSG